MKLTGRQRSELRSLAAAGKLWGGVPPQEADSSLSMYIHKGLVAWKGDGYVITEAGRALLALQENSNERL